ncbi:MAG TPA: tetratricopeptide repeat protein [Candidatus Ozemobacteraceae bacterium]|nr:tetratricopeptide repeat protein [Candidatus Ozemobacteraceae bacterium]
MTRLLLLCALILLISPASAVTPDIRLPEWHQLDLKLKPAEKTDSLKLCVSVRALIADLRDLSISMRLPNGMTVTPAEQRQPFLKRGETWEATFVTGFKPGANGWVEIAAAARPDIPQMEQWLRNVATYSATARLILQTEIQRFIEPMQIGRIFPISVTTELSALTPRFFLFESLPLGKAHRVFVWAPDGEFSLPAPKRALREMRALMQREEWGKAAASARALATAVQSAAEITFIAPGQRRMSLSKDMINSAIAASVPALEALAGNHEEAHQALQRQATEDKNPFSAYIQANLGALHATNGRVSEARAAFTKALDLFPLWILMREQLARLSSGGEK